MQNKDTTIWFTPEIGIDPDLDFSGLSIKGNKPLIEYPFEMRGLYSIVPSLNAYEAYKVIRKDLLNINILLFEKLQLRDRFSLPKAKTESEARTILSILFNPSTFNTSGIASQIKNIKGQQINFFQFSNIYPFSLRLASARKLAHTLVWIDTNIKVKLEKTGKSIRLNHAIIIQLAEVALKIYAIIVKMDDYTLAQTMNFNYSMFLQDRILNMMLGDEIYVKGEEMETKGKISNKMSLELYKSLGALSYKQLISLSTFMGVVWTSVEDIQKEFDSNPEKAFSKIESQLISDKRKWGINHTEKFLQDISENEDGSVAIILDDNGESAIDLVLFQRLLEDFPLLKLTFVVNIYPISNNISLNVFQSLIDDEFFSALRQNIAEGRVNIVLEEQTFRSFEIDFLKSETLLAIKNTDLVFIKGLNFFETFQLISVPRYHCFTVYGPTSVSLTGCQEGNGIFAKLPAGRAGFIYNNFNQIETLQKIVSETEMNNGE